jgi:phosphoribosylpyrophosphate synthetase
VESLHTQYEVEKIYVAVSHMKMQPEFIPALVEAHEKYGLVELHVTDTVPQIPDLVDLPFVTVHSLARRFAATINRLHYNRSVSDLFFRL